MSDTTKFGKPEVRTDSDHSFHKDLYRTLVLLAIDGKERPVYFVVEGLCSNTPDTDPDDHSRYFYEEHTCPTNFVGQHADGYGVVALYENGDSDPHGVFRFVRAVWMPQRYVDAKNEYKQRGHNMGWMPEDVLEQLFPELIEGCSRRCIHQGKPDSESANVVGTMSVGMDGSSTSVSRGEYTHVHNLAPGETCDHPDRVVHE